MNHHSSSAHTRIISAIKMRQKAATLYEIELHMEVTTACAEYEEECDYLNSLKEKVVSGSVGGHQVPIWRDVPATLVLDNMLVQAKAFGDRLSCQEIRATIRQVKAGNAVYPSKFSNLRYRPLTTTKKSSPTSGCQRRARHGHPSIPCVLVVLLDGSTIRVPYRRRMSVFQLKRAITRRVATGVPAHTMSLKCGPKYMGNRFPLSDYGIRPGTIIVQGLSLRGGGGGPEAGSQAGGGIDSSGLAKYEIKAGYMIHPFMAFSLYQ